MQDRQDNSWSMLPNRIIRDERLFEFFNKNRDALMLYTYLLVLANHEDYTTKGVLVKRGQALFSMRKLSRILARHLSSIFRDTKRMKIETLIETVETDEGTLFTILYDSSVSKIETAIETGSETQIETGQTEKSRQLSKNKNLVEENKKKNKTKKRRNKNSGTMVFEKSGVGVEVRGVQVGRKKPSTSTSSIFLNKEEDGLREDEETGKDDSNTEELFEGLMEPVVPEEYKGMDITRDEYDKLNQIELDRIEFFKTVLEDKYDVVAYWRKILSTFGVTEKFKMAKTAKGDFVEFKVAEDIIKNCKEGYNLTREIYDYAFEKFLNKSYKTYKLLDINIVLTWISSLKDDFIKRRIIRDASQPGEKRYLLDSFDDSEETKRRREALIEQEKNKAEKRRQELIKKYRI